MTTKIEVPKELLAQIDFSNTVNGGIAQFTTQAWKEEKGYHQRVNSRKMRDGVCTKLKSTRRNSQLSFLFIMLIVFYLKLRSKTTHSLTVNS